MKVHAYASWPHYAEHIAPIWNWLPDEYKGDFVAASSSVDTLLRRHGIVPVASRHKGQIAEGLKTREPIIVAGYADLRKMRRRPVVFVEHGAGQTYIGDDGTIHGGYSGGMNRDNVELFICPNNKVAERNLAVYPAKKAAVCGSPRLDDLLQTRLGWAGDGQTVAIAFHWNCQIAPESGTAFPYFAKQISDFARMARTCGLEVIGHGHPKSWPFYKDWWETQNVATEASWPALVQQIDLLIADNSSIVFEAAALGIPVVLLESPRWRRNVEHGLRFWEHADVGPSVLPDEDLGEAMSQAFTESWRVKREAVAQAVYAVPPSVEGSASRMAGEAILRYLL
jgi:hypothetical protein